MNNEYVANKWWNSPKKDSEENQNHGICKKIDKTGTHCTESNNPDLEKQ